MSYEMIDRFLRNNMTCSCPAFARQVEAAVWAKFAAVKQDEAIKEKLK